MSGHEPRAGGAPPPDRDRRASRDLPGVRPDHRRLDVPRTPGPSFRPRYDPELFGRFAEAFARFMGTARFLAYMTVFVIVWITINLVGIFGLKWDPYPFILLNLFFSTQASYAAPLILLAQNRQEARDRVQYDQDRDVSIRTRADMEFLAREVASLRLAMGDVATRDFLRSELRALLTELDERKIRRPSAEAARGSTRLEPQATDPPDQRETGPTSARPARPDQRGDGP
jgi:uncharacterized membrane protein